jgi:hypothetical protein
MSNSDIKRPQRIWTAQEVTTGAVPEPVQPPSKAGERFGRLLQTPRPSDTRAGASLGRGLPKQVASVAADLSAAAAQAACQRKAAGPRKDGADVAPQNAAADDTPAPRPAPRPVPAMVVQPAAMTWSDAEPWQQAWRDGALSMAPSAIEGAQSQPWPQDVAAAAVVLCQRAGDQFTSWRVAVPLDEEALPETELWLEASPGRLSLRFRSLSAWSVRLISMHEERLLLLLRQRLGSSRDVDVEIT